MYISSSLLATCVYVHIRSDHVLIRSDQIIFTCICAYAVQQQQLLGRLKYACARACACVCDCACVRTLACKVHVLYEQGGAGAHMMGGPRSI